MKPFFLNMILLLSLVFLSSCGDEDKEESRYQEGLEQQQQERIEASNQNIEEWSLRLEKDIDQRRAFINAVESEFEGSFEAKGIVFRIRFIISSTAPDYDPDRVRTLEELNQELKKLNLNIHVVQWPESNIDGAIGCVFENIQPDIKKGHLDLFSKSCSVSYKLKIADSDDLNVSTSSINLASDIINSGSGYIDFLNGKFQTSTSGRSIKISVKRAE